MISATSRYQRNGTAQVTDRRGRQQVMVLRRPPAVQNLVVSDHLWSDFSRVDTVSAGAYGVAEAWWMIGEANPQVLDWTQLPAGSRVMVPRGTV
jgi:hypothetical protein